MKRKASNHRLGRRLGRRIRLRRKELRLTQRGLARAANLSSQRQAWTIEHGLTGVTIETAQRIAHALGWSLSQLFDGL
jgi:transcriptional regulator with XRE-family HTH domain